MASSAGQQLVAGRIPGERIATSIETTDSGGTTDGDELVVMSVTAPLVSGRTYRVTARGAIEGTGDERAQVHIREDNLAGTLLQNRNVYIHDGSGFGNNIDAEAEFTAGSTENKTFVVTIERNLGTGPINLSAFSTRPAYLYVDYISG